MKNDFRRVDGLSSEIHTKGITMYKKRCAHISIAFRVGHRHQRLQPKDTSAVAILPTTTELNQRGDDNQHTVSTVRRLRHLTLLTACLSSITAVDSNRLHFFC